MLEREQLLLRTLLQDLGDVFQRTGLPGVYTLPLPEAFLDKDAFSDPLLPTEQLERLRPVFENITGLFSQKDPAKQSFSSNRYPLKALSLNPEDVMPQTEENMPGYLREDYRLIWLQLLEDMGELQRSKQFHTYFFTLYFLLKKYLSRVPSKHDNDISFFDAARVATAIADCQYQYHIVHQGKNSLHSPSPEQESTVVDEKQDVLLIEGQVSGIQTFLYSMASPPHEHACLAKRLKGRSFYLNLLTETIVDYLIAQLDLTIVHQIWCTGGHFLLMAPNIPAVTYHLKACFQEINEFMFRKFRGELAFVLENVPVSTKALHEQIGSVLLDLHARLDRESMRALYAVLQDQDSWQFPVETSDNDSTDDDFIDRLHKEHEQLGARIPRLQQEDGRLVKKIKPAAESWKEPPLVEFAIGKETHIGWDINPREYAQTDTIYLVNNLDEKFWGSSSLKYGFKLLPTHLDTYSASEADQVNAARSQTKRGLATARVNPDDVKHFDDMARTGTGGYLGVLQMDVDRLDAVLGAGLPAPKCSFPRMAAVSTELDFFFSAYVNHICRTSFHKNTSLIHAGGDDLFIIGAWDELVNLACRIRQDFHTFTSQHLTLSGSLFLCQKTFPITRAAEHARHMLQTLAKENIAGESLLSGKVRTHNAFAFFHHRIDWDDFFTLRETGDQLVTAITKGKLSRKSLFKLLHLHRTWGRYRQLNTVRLFYITARTIQNRVCRDLLLAQHHHLANSSYLPALVSYTALKTRTPSKEASYAES